MPNLARHDDADAKTTRVVAKLLREILAGESFDNCTDLRDVLWHRCLRLGIHPTVATVDDAFRLVASNSSIIDGDVPASRQFSDNETGPMRRVSQGEAAALLDRLGVRVRGMR